MVVKYVRALLASLLMAGGVSGVATAAAADLSQIDPAVLAVAQSYFDALQAGDGNALLSLFAGDERARNKAQLSDPDYSQFLVDRYRDARFEVSDGGVRNGVSYVDVRIWISDTESFNERLIIGSSGDPADTSTLHIVARKELEGQ
jgi:hypothetical protein